jgi:chitin synthase
MPNPDAMFVFQREFESDFRCAGVCGELKVERLDAGMVPMMHRMLHMVQYYEYKAANLVDRSFESKLGFISVLPGLTLSLRLTRLFLN